MLEVLVNELLNFVPSDSIVSGFVDITLIGSKECLVGCIVGGNSQRRNPTPVGITADRLPTGAAIGGFEQKIARVAQRRITGKESLIYAIAR